MKGRKKTETKEGAYLWLMMLTRGDVNDVTGVDDDADEEAARKKTLPYSVVRVNKKESEGERACGG